MEKVLLVFFKVFFYLFALFKLRLAEHNAKSLGRNLTCDRALAFILPRFSITRSIS